MSFGVKRTIDLEPYGVRGTIVMSMPTFRRTNRMNNMIGSMVKIVDGEFALKEGTIPLGDINAAGVLAFVESAPFKMDLESFYQFTDKVDEATGRGQELFSLMEKYAQEINKGDNSPFVDSQKAETVNSE